MSECYQVCFWFSEHAPGVRRGEDVFTLPIHRQLMLGRQDVEGAMP